MMGWNFLGFGIYGGFMGYWVFAAFIAVDGAEFVAGGAVFLLLGYGGEVGDVVGGGHGDEAGPEAGEGGVVVEVGVVLGVDVEEVEGLWIVWRWRFLRGGGSGAGWGVRRGGRGRPGWVRGEGVGGCVGVVEGEGGEGVGL